MTNWCARAAIATLVLMFTGCGGSAAPGGSGGTQLDDTQGTPVTKANIVENFNDTSNMDVGASQADWGTTETGVLLGLATTSRTVHSMGYEFADNATNGGGTDSGRGQYFADPASLVGPNYVVNSPGSVPATSFGRRVQICIPDTKLGAAGTITHLAWGPANNATFASTHTNVKIRLGTLASGFGTSLGAHAANNYASTPTVVYDGAYVIAQNANVGNTPGHPVTGHVGGYPQGGGCRTTPGGWNKPLFDFTGMYDWPALTSTYNWSPGDPNVDNDSTLIVDVSATEGTVFQLMRVWFGVTSPCTGLLIPEFPRRRLDTTYEADDSNPHTNHPAGILNPWPAEMDVSITLTQNVSLAQSKWLQGAYGDDTDYLTPIVLPVTQTGKAKIIVEYQGADKLLTSGAVDMSGEFTDWVQDLNDCDGMKNVRFRVHLIQDPTSGTAARVEKIDLPMIDSDPTN